MILIPALADCISIDPNGQGRNDFFPDFERNVPYPQFNLGKRSGAYKNHHKSRKTYVGKGKEDRAKASANRVAKRHKDPYTHREVTTADSDKEAFKQESRMLDEEGGPKCESNYNVRESPDKKLRKDDGELCR